MASQNTETETYKSTRPFSASTSLLGGCSLKRTISQRRSYHSVKWKRQLLAPTAGTTAELSLPSFPGIRFASTLHFNLHASHVLAQEGDVLVFFTVHNVSARHTFPKRRSIESDTMDDGGRYLYRTFSCFSHFLWLCRHLFLRFSSST